MPRDPTVRVENKIATTLKKFCKQEHIDEKLCGYLVSRYSSRPQLYGLPKVHKDGLPMHPILSVLGEQNQHPSSPLGGTVELCL